MVTTRSMARNAGFRRKSAPRLSTRKRKNAFATTWSENGVPRKRMRARRVPTRSVTTTTSSRPKGRSKKLSRSYGYKRSKFRASRIRTSLLVPYTVERLQGIKREAPATGSEPGVVPGFYRIDAPDPAAGGAGSYPIMVIAMNTLNNRTSTTTPVFWKLNVADTGVVSFVDSQSQRAGGTIAASAWVPEIQNGFPPVNGYGCRYAQHLWFDVRFKLYGCRRQDTTYDLTLVSFKNQALVPDTTTWDAQFTNHRYRFWQELARPAVVNSIMPGGFNWRRDVNIIRSKRVTIKADTTLDMDTNPKSMDFRWRIRDGKVRDYRENPTVFTNEGLMNSTNWIQYGTGGSVNITLNDVPHRLYDRVYLIIRATDMFPTSSDPVYRSADYDPSFDMCIRRKTMYYPIAAPNFNP